MVHALEMALPALDLLSRAGGAAMTRGARRMGALAATVGAVAGRSVAPVSRRRAVTRMAWWPLPVPDGVPSRGQMARMSVPRTGRNGPLSQPAAAAARSGGRAVFRNHRVSGGAPPLVGPAGRVLAAVLPGLPGHAGSRRLSAAPGAVTVRRAVMAAGGPGPAATVRAMRAMQAVPTPQRRSARFPASGTPGRHGADAMPLAGPFAPPATTRQPPDAASWMEGAPPPGGVSSQRRGGSSGSAEVGQSIGGALHLDGDALGQFITRHLERVLTAAPRGPTGIDPRAVPVWSAASAGF